MNVARVCQHAFLREPLGPGAIVLDCGVNRGHFSQWIAENIGCTVHGFEPDPRFHAKLPEVSGCTFHPLAVASAPGRLRLSLGNTLCSSLHFREGEGAEVVDVEAVTLPDFCRERGIERIDLLKLDVEGEEIPILTALDARFLRERVAQLTVEFHDHKDEKQIPHIRAVIRRLRGLGFFVLPFTVYTYGDVLFVNRALIPLSLPSIATIQLAKYRWGLGRVAARVRSGGPLRP